MQKSTKGTGDDKKCGLVFAKNRAQLSSGKDFKFQLKDQKEQTLEEIADVIKHILNQTEPMPSETLAGVLNQYLSDLTNGPMDLDRLNQCAQLFMYLKSLNKESVERYNGNVVRSTRSRITDDGKMDYNCNTSEVKESTHIRSFIKALVYTHFTRYGDTARSESADFDEQKRFTVFWETLLYNNFNPLNEKVSQFEVSIKIPLKSETSKSLPSTSEEPLLQDRVDKTLRQALPDVLIKEIGQLIQSRELSHSIKGTISEDPCDVAADPSHICGDDDSFDEFQMKLTKKLDLLQLCANTASLNELINKIRAAIPKSDPVQESQELKRLRSDYQSLKERKDELDEMVNTLFDHVKMRAKCG